MKKIIPFLLILFSLQSMAQSQIVWDNTIDIATSTYDNEYPHIALNASGNPVVIWGRTSDESLFYARWDGTQFTAPIKLNDSLTIASAYWMGPEIASHGDTIYVVMKETPESDTSSHVHIVRSFDGGISFSSPNRVDYIGDSLSRFTTVTTDQTGNPIIAYMKIDNSWLNHRWVVTKSTDYGNTFSSDVKASGWGNSAEACDCCPGTVVSNANTCAVVYRDNNNNLRDIWAGISYNNAQSFTNGFNIDNNSWMINSCPASGPDAVLIGDTLYSVFMNGGSGKNLNYFSKSDVNGNAVNLVSPLSGFISGLLQQSYPRIANDGNAVAIVWKQVVSGSAQIPILYTDDITQGLPAVYDTVDIDNITNEDVEIGNGKVFVVWQDFSSNTVKYRSGTIAPVTTGIAHNTPSFIADVFPNPARDYIQIAFNHNSNKEYLIRLLDTQGRLISDFYNASEINISDLESGVYFIHIEQNGFSGFAKFLKLD